MNDNKSLDEYINNTLAQKFSELTLNDPPLALYACPTACSVLMTLGRQGIKALLTSKKGRRGKAFLISIKRDLTPS